MGANAATKLFRVLENTETILAIELLNAAQAIEFRRPLKSSEKMESLFDLYRDAVSFMEEDRILHDDIAASKTFLQKIDAEKFL
jgi:histidine ammonia-lyase